jgi:uncharacterized protein (DUF433 family)
MQTTRRTPSEIALGRERRRGFYARNILALKPAPLPLVMLGDGTIRVAGTRVPLDTIVYAFRAGATPEEITHQYTTVALDAVYAIIAWILQNKGEVDAYMARREEESARIREECERLHPMDGIRERLLARKAAGGGST